MAWPVWRRRRFCSLLNSNLGNVDMGVATSGNLRGELYRRARGFSAAAPRGPLHKLVIPQARKRDWQSCVEMLIISPPKLLARGVFNTARPRHGCTVG